MSKSGQVGGKLFGKFTYLRKNLNQKHKEITWKK